MAPASGWRLKQEIPLKPSTTLYNATSQRSAVMISTSVIISNLTKVSGLINKQYISVQNVATRKGKINPVLTTRSGFMNLLHFMIKKTLHGWLIFWLNNNVLVYYEVPLIDVFRKWDKWTVSHSQRYQLYRLTSSSGTSSLHSHIDNTYPAFHSQHSWVMCSFPSVQSFCHFCNQVCPFERTAIQPLCVMSQWLARCTTILLFGVSLCAILSSHDCCADRLGRQLCTRK